jgi:hypothetical protein
MLQIHSYDQLAQGVVISLTTVDGRCKKKTSFLWTSLHRGQSQFILEKKNHLNKTIKSLSPFYPIHVTIES